MIEELTNLAEGWVTDANTVALVQKQSLLPIDGLGGVIFPPTYAGGNYTIDMMNDGTKTAVIDSVGSQANRIEPVFLQDDYRSLVPQVDIAYGNERQVSLLEIGHRLGDAFVRSSELGEEAQQAFNTFLATGRVDAIAKLAPTSLVFGVWDSRDTQAKLPRIVQSTIRAYDVDELKRSAQYAPPVDYAGLDVISESDQAKGEKSPLAQRGFLHVPSVDTHGGIIAHGSVQRTTSLNLVALRRLQGSDDTALRRYLLGLSLVCATAPQDGFLRQGCFLTPDPSCPAEWEVVSRDGTRSVISLDHAQFIAFARNAAEVFGVGPDRQCEFSIEKARKDASGAKKK